MDRQDLIEKLFSSNQALQRAWKTYFYQVLGDENLSPAQMGLLFFINHHAPISGKDLAVKMQISRSAVTQLADGLDRGGFITREEDSNDRRIVYIRLSEAGTCKLNQLEGRRKDYFISTAATLSDEELQIMTSIQTKMMRQIESNTHETI